MADVEAGSDAHLIDAVRAEQVRLLYANGGAPMLVTLLTGLALAWILVGAEALAQGPALAWSGAMVAHTLARQALRRAYLRSRGQASRWRVWRRRFIVGALVGGATWGAGALLMLSPGRTDLQMLVVAVLIAVVYGTMTGWGTSLAAFYALFLPAFTPVVAWFALQGDPVQGLAAVLLVLWMATVAVLARRYHKSLVRALELSAQNEALARAAQQASLAKSRFLAAASHDLRQPVHALGMFIGALRSLKLSRRSVEIVEQMDASVAALDTLFASLLDISRLDAGAVESRPQVVALQPLLARICRELEVEAAAKGVDLVSVPTTAAVHSDPVLLERVMRNLIGNAVRYTEQGWVMVGCRRSGANVCLEVRDTGPGIPEALQEAVFEEFYQIGNPDRDRLKGLGLGLPIVRRLTAILGHRLEMESAPGEGAFFRVIAPRAEAVDATPAETPVQTGRVGVILAVDDDQAIRAAMGELLKTWGHQVVTVASGEEALSAVAAGLRPDLIICDHRLRAGESGLDAIANLRTALRSDVPAILVTGDTAPEALRLAMASGNPLLHKPLSHGKLRAAVNNLLRRGAGLRAEA